MKVIQFDAETKENNLKVNFSDHANLVKEYALPIGEYSYLLLAG